MFDVYIISYKKCKNNCKKKLLKLKKTLKQYNFENIYTCSGNENISQLNVDWNKDNKHYYIWTTHKAAILKYISTNSDNNLLIVEDDLEFIHSPHKFNIYLQNILNQLQHKKWDMIMLGGLPLGFTIPVSKNILISQSPRSSQCVLYNKQYVHTLYDKDFFRYDYGEGWYSLPIHKRFVSNPILTTQNVLPQEVPHFAKKLHENYKIPFKIFHNITFYTTLIYSLSLCILIILTCYKFSKFKLLLLISNFFMLYSYLLYKSPFTFDKGQFPIINKKNNNIILQEFCP